MKLILYTILIVTICSCGFKRNCKPIIKDFSYADEKRIDAFGQTVIHEQLSNAADTYTFKIFKPYSSYGQGESEGVNIIDTHYKPKVKRAFYEYHLAYDISVANTHIMMLRIPLDKQGILDTSSDYIDGFNENIQLLKELVAIEAFKNIEEVPKIAKAFGYRKNQCNGVVEYNDKYYLSFVNYSGLGCMQSPTLYINLRQHTDIIEIGGLD